MVQKVSDSVYNLPEHWTWLLGCSYAFCNDDVECFYILHNRTNYCTN